MMHPKDLDALRGTRPENCPTGLKCVHKIYLRIVRRPGMLVWDLYTLSTRKTYGSLVGKRTIFREAAQFQRRD